MDSVRGLEGRHAVVTGGAKGIGRAVAQRLAAEGASVEVWDLSPVGYSGVTSRVVDVTRAESVAQAVGAIGAARRIDVLVNNAGYLGTVTPFLEHDPADWQRIVAVNLLGMMTVAQAIAPRMRAAGGGRIVNLGSLAGKEGLAGLVAYSAASGGVIAFTKALGRELAAANVRVNCVAPGPIDTDMIRDLGPATVQGMIADSPLKRLGRPEEVAELVAWLCSDACTFSTGAVYDISGGRARY